MTLSKTDHEVGSPLAAAKTQTVIDVEALRDRCVQKLLKARQWCEEIDTLHADNGARTGGPVDADQEHAQWLLCLAVRDLEEIDALLHQRRPERR